MSDRVVVIGSVNVDRTIAVDRFPRPGETLMARGLTRAIGGKGANQAVAAAKAGAAVTMAAMLGDDAEGDLAQQALDRAGIDTGFVRRISGEPTGSAWITVASGDNTILVVPGANHRWSGDTLQLHPSDVVLCQLEIPQAVVETAAAAPGTFLLNAAPAAQLTDDLLGHCDVLIVNEHELAEVSGCSDVDASDAVSVAAAARVLIDRGAGAVVTTLGGRGAVLCTKGAVSTAAAPPAQVVDSTGAGDAFCGVFAAQLAAGASLVKALRYAVTAGSIAVRHRTAQGGYDSFGQLAAFIGQTPEITTESSA